MGQSKPIRPTAIVVEDDDIQREMLALLLEGSNFDVLQCEDAETAVLALKAKHPALIVTDINLVGKMDGVDLAHFAQQQHSGVRIIVISGRPLPRPRGKVLHQAGLPDGSARGSGAALAVAAVSCCGKALSSKPRGPPVMLIAGCTCCFT